MSKHIETKSLNKGYSHTITWVRVKGLEIYVGLLFYDGRVISKHTAWSERGIRTSLAKSLTTIAA